MKIYEAINMVNDIKPNAFGENQKVFWLNALEQSLALEVFLMSPAEAAQLKLTPDDKDAEMLLMSPYDDLYVMWLAAKIDEANGEYSKYQNSMQTYTVRRDEFVCWFCNRYDPVMRKLPRDGRCRA